MLLMSHVGDVRDVKYLNKRSKFLCWILLQEEKNIAQTS